MQFAHADASQSQQVQQSESRRIRYRLEQLVKSMLSHLFILICVYANETIIEELGSLQVISTSNLGKNEVAREPAGKCSKDRNHEDINNCRFESEDFDDRQNVWKAHSRPRQ